MTLAAQAREAAGLSVQEAARRAHITEGYLRRIESKGAPYMLARRLAALYECRVDVFLPRKTSTPAKRKRKEAVRHHW